MSAAVSFWGLAALGAGIAAATSVATRGVLGYLRRRAVLDLPNERSSHSIPTPRGGGLAVILVLIPAWGALSLAATAPAPGAGFALAAALALGALSWLDDVGGLSPLVRLLVQVGAVAATLVAMGDAGPFLGGLLPRSLDGVVAGLAWVWFVNLYNFMDGIDGITGVETASIGAGVAGVALIGGLGGPLPAYGVVIAACALGFLRWNWHPARIFLGDVGSVPLGFLLGWLLLVLAAKGQWVAALVLPLYYLVDATLTLARRGLRGEKVWKPHREHLYQRAVQAGRSHAAVSAAVLVADVALVVLAGLAAAGWPWPALIGAAAVVAALLLWLSVPPRGAPRGPSP